MKTSSLFSIALIIVGFNPWHRGCSSVVEHVLCMYKALGLTPSISNVCVCGLCWSCVCCRGGLRNAQIEQNQCLPRIDVWGSHCEYKIYPKLTWIGVACGAEEKGYSLALHGLLSQHPLVCLIKVSVRHSSNQILRVRILTFGKLFGKQLNCHLVVPEFLSLLLFASFLRGCSSVEERVLCMYKVLGSIPSISNVAVCLIWSTASWA